MKQEFPSDRLLEGILRRTKNLEWGTTTSEYKVFRVNQFYKGSIWIRPKKGGYRVQTTGLAQNLDPFIERLAGSADGAQKPQQYQFWSLIGGSQLERIIEEFNRG